MVVPELPRTFLLGTVIQEVLQSLLPGTVLLSLREEDRSPTSFGGRCGKFRFLEEMVECEAAEAAGQEVSTGQSNTRIRPSSGK